MKKGRVSERQTKAWAAYVLGHDIKSLWDQHYILWKYKKEFVTRKITWGWESLSVFDGLDSAVESLLHLDLIEAEEAYTIGASLARWKHELEILLIELDHPDTTTMADWWEEEYPPGLANSAEVLRAVNRVCLRDKWLADWNRIGLWISWGAILPDKGVTETAESLRLFVRLSRGLEIKEPGAVAEFLETYSEASKAPPEIEGILTPGGSFPTASRVDAFVRAALEKRATKPLVVLSLEIINFFGTRLLPTALGPREQALLWLLCENPKALVTRSQIIEAANSPGYKEQHVPAIASRLRRQLKPAVKEFARRSGRDQEKERNKDCDICFINFMGSDYILEIEPVQVVVRGERPRGMKVRPPEPLPRQQ